MPVPESRLVGWTMESNDKGQWALFMRCGFGTRVIQLTRYYSSPDELEEAIRQKFADAQLS